MQTAARIILSVFLISSVVTSAYRSQWADLMPNGIFSQSTHGDGSGAKLRRDGVLNLYPFPRVGRSGTQTWKIPMNDYPESEPAVKRQLYAFPRVGRSPSYLDLTPLKLEELLLKSRRAHDFVKRESEGNTDSGMWFGPRLGRGFRSEDDDITQNESERSEQEQLDQEHIERKKRDAKQH